MRGQHPIFKTPPLFVFDLDSTITKCELLPFLAAPVGKAEEMAALTEQAMGENAGFAQNFADRVSLLISQPVSRLRRMAADVPLHTHIVDFICEARERCLIVTGNLDAWIDSLIERLQMRGRCFCSQALIHNDHIQSISRILDKRAVAAHLPHPFIAIGDGDNDLGLFSHADLSLGFSGARALSPRVQAAVDIIFSDEIGLASYLRTFL